MPWLLRLQMAARSRSARRTLLAVAVSFGVPPVCAGALYAQAVQRPVSVGTSVQVLYQGTWYPAFVLAVGGDQVRVRYDGYDASWDEWVGPDRVRLPVRRGQTPTASPSRVSTFRDGERVEARYQGLSVYHPAVIVAVLQDGRYKVRYTGGWPQGREEVTDGSEVRPVARAAALPAVVPTGRYQCYLGIVGSAGEGAAYMGMFEVTSATEYRYVTGHRRTGMFNYNRASGRIAFHSGELDGRVFSGQFSFGRNDNRPYITLRYRDGQGRDAEQHCGKV